MSSNGQIMPCRAQGCVSVEATAVQAEGRISYADFRVMEMTCSVRSSKHSCIKLKVCRQCHLLMQLAHAGRKASTDKPSAGQGDS